MIACVLPQTDSTGRKQEANKAGQRHPRQHLPTASNEKPEAKWERRQFHNHGEPDRDSRAHKLLSGEQSQTKDRQSQHKTVR